MKRLILLTLAVLAPFSAADEKRDPVEDTLREAWAEYKTGNYDVTREKLAEVMKMLEEKDAEKIEELLPKELDGWEGETLQRDDLGAVGGGLSISRLYEDDKKKVTVKVVKNSPLMKTLIPLLANEQLIELSGRKTHRISGETAVMDGPKKLQMVLDGRIYVELAGSGEAEEKDIVSLARKLDLRALEKIK
ncbi:conserved hypothetical protein [Haloferula helveola]|uniref:Uncharacterized protein n=1 Tax=Haloferula helveola TaxID=490095 RepID=A0ABN6H581_9BACT|nr:conserved hypothetical protein [Haloferula helveola]